MGAIEEKVEIGVPVRTAYNQWTRFKSFPRYTSTVKEVDQIRPNVTCWTIAIGPLRRELDVEIVEQDPDSRMAWRSLDSRPSHRGEVLFRSLDTERTEIVVRVQYEPRGARERLAAFFGVPHRMVRTGLGHFKDFVESLGDEGSGWRGSITSGRVRPVEATPPRSLVPNWPTG